MKRTILFLSILALMMSLSVSASANVTERVRQHQQLCDVALEEVSGCVHEQYEAAGLAREACEYVSEARHWNQVLVDAYCMQCPHQVTVILSGEYTLHNWVTYDLGHAEDEFFHTYRDVCRDCGRKAERYSLICVDEHIVVL